MTSPKSKVQPKLKSFHEEKSPKMRMINGQSTESLESLSDELASNSGGNNSTNEVTNRRGRVRSNKIRHCLQNPSIAVLHFHLLVLLTVPYLMMFYCYRGLSITDTGGAGLCMTARPTTMTSSHSRRAT